MITKNFEEAVASWQQRVVVKKGKGSGDETLEQRQTDLVTAANEGMSALVEYLREQLGFTNRKEILETRQEIPMLVRRLTVNESQYVPVELEQEIAKSFNTISAADAVRPAFWTAMHIIWAEEDLLEQGWASKLVKKDDDDTARTICRALGGLPHVRGKISVLVDCPLARAWWRVRMAGLIADASDEPLDIESIHRMLHSSTVWATLAGELVRRVAVMNEPRALAAMFSLFSEGHTPLNDKNILNMIRRMASYSTVVNFSVVPFADMKKLCSAIGQEGFTGSS